MTQNVIHLRATRRWRWLVAPAVALAAGVAGWGWWDAGHEAPSTSHAASRAVWPVVPDNAAQDAGALLFSKAPLGDSRPPDFSQADWDNLNKALAHDPNKDKERNRVVAYLRFQRAVSKWSEMSNGPASPERLALARQVVQALPDHVADGEVNPGEALAVLTAVAVDIEPDPGRRATWIEGERNRLMATETTQEADTLRADQARNDAFEKEKADITARWQNAPEAQRDPATLEAQLQALRERVYGAASR